MNPKQTIIILFILLFAAGCSANNQEESTATPTRIFITATFIQSATPPVSETPLPPPPTPTTVPVDGIASTQVNVRAQPSTAGEVLGIVAANAKVQIIGKDPGGNWWQILYPAGVDGKGWVTAQYVTTAGEAQVPVIGGGGTKQNNGKVAIIQQQLNVRSGPGTDFHSLGTLNPQDVVNLIGKDANGAWLQVEYALGPEGKGWINAAFAQAQGVENLPIVAESGQIVGTGTPTDIPPTPTSTLLPAPNDNDSANDPSVDVVFSVTGTKSFQYKGDVSSPEGDTEDWLRLTPYTQFVRFDIDCSGSNEMVMEIVQDSTVQQSLSCGSSIVVATLPNAEHLIHIQVSSKEGLQYTGYSLRVTSVP